MNISVCCYTDIPTSFWRQELEEPLRHMFSLIKHLKIPPIKRNCDCLMTALHSVNLGCMRWKMANGKNFATSLVMALIQWSYISHRKRFKDGHCPGLVTNNNPGQKFESLRNERNNCCLWPMSTKQPIKLQHKITYW